MDVQALLEPNGSFAKSACRESESEYIRIYFWILRRNKLTNVDAIASKYLHNTTLGAKLGLCRSIIYYKLGAGGG